MKLLIFVDWFSPGFKGGGPIRSTVNLAKALKKEFEVFVISTDTDFGDSMPYKDLQANEWTNEFDVVIPVFYYSKQNLTYQNLLKLLSASQPDVIYLNSMFSLPFTIWPLYMKWRKQITAKVVLAPRGMLHAGAMGFKSKKKGFFLALIKLLGWHKNIHFHATDLQEQKDIEQTFGKQVKQSLIPNLPGLYQHAFVPVEKNTGKVDLVFISRVHPKKNIVFLLKALQQVKGTVNLSIIGGVEDEVYLQECKNIIRQLPSSIKVNWIGALENNLVQQQLEKHHFFVLPTLGENFGHAIFEAFLAGRPVLISDKTPWNNLEAQGIGWDIWLSNETAWITALQEVINMNQEVFDARAFNAWSFANNYLKKSSDVEKYIELFSAETITNVVL